MKPTVLQINAGAGWPVLVGILGFASGVLMLAGAGLLHYQTRQQMQAAALDVPGVPVRAAAAAATRGAESPLPQLPGYATHLDDISAVFQLAKDQGVVLGPINYRSDINAAMPVVVRSVELRLDEEYPKLKGFVAELLRKMPHLYLEEIRVEQASAPNAKLQASLKISFAYVKTSSDVRARDGKGQ